MALDYSKVSVRGGFAHPKQKTPTRRKPQGATSGLRGLIAEYLKGAPAQQNEAERGIQAQQSQEQQLYGTTGRADVAAGRSAATAEQVRQTRAGIGEQAKLRGIGLEFQRQGLGLQRAELNSQLRTARLRRSLLQQGLQQPPKKKAIQLRRGVTIEGGGMGFATRNKYL